MTPRASVVRWLLGGAAILSALGMIRGATAEDLAAQLRATGFKIV